MKSNRAITRHESEITCTDQCKHDPLAKKIAHTNNLGNLQLE